jgi:hypothetical protein
MYLTRTSEVKIFSKFCPRYLDISLSGQPDRKNIPDIRVIKSNVFHLSTSYALKGTEVNTYIALFRGINVGGKNILPLKEVIRIFEEMGCE